MLQTTDDKQTDGRVTAYSKREREFTLRSRSLKIALTTKNTFDKDFVLRHNDSTVLRPQLHSK